MIWERAYYQLDEALNHPFHFEAYLMYVRMQANIGILRVSDHNLIND